MGSGRKHTTCIQSNFPSAQGCKFAYLVRLALGSGFSCEVFQGRVARDTKLAAQFRFDGAVHVADENAAGAFILVSELIPSCVRNDKRGCSNASRFLFFFLCYSPRYRGKSRELTWSHGFAVSTPRSEEFNDGVLATASHFGLKGRAGQFCRSLSSQNEKSALRTLYAQRNFLCYKRTQNIFLGQFLPPKQQRSHQAVKEVSFFVLLTEGVIRNVSVMGERKRFCFFFGIFPSSSHS